VYRPAKERVPYIGDATVEATPTLRAAKKTEDERTMMGDVECVDSLWLKRMILRLPAPKR
jgi:hypothetical protein